jgi:hypothetical protein
VTTSDVERSCIHHEQAPAIAICTECTGDVCGACHGSDLRGYCVCAVCRQKYAPPTTAWEDPSRDYSPGAFAQTLRDVITSPRTFFEQVRLSEAWVPAVVFGALCMSVGLVFSTGWQLLFTEQFNQALVDYADQAGVGVQTFQTLMFALIPVRVIIGFGVHVGVLHLAIKLAGAQASFSLTARIVGYASAGYAFLLVPPIGEFALGHFLAIIWIFNLEVSALRTYFQLGMWRSLFVVMATLLLILPFMA